MVGVAGTVESGVVQGQTGPLRGGCGSPTRSVRRGVGNTSTKHTCASRRNRLYMPYPVVACQVSECNREYNVSIARGSKTKLCWLLPSFIDPSFVSEPLQAGKHRRISHDTMKLVKSTGAVTETRGRFQRRVREYVFAEWKFGAWFNRAMTKLAARFRGWRARKAFAERLSFLRARQVD